MFPFEAQLETLSMITAFLMGLLYCGIVVLLAWGFNAIVVPLIKKPEVASVISTVVWVVAGVLCLLILIGALTGGLPKLVMSGAAALT